jgi:hypothetical protein
MKTENPKELKKNGGIETDKCGILNEELLVFRWGLSVKSVALNCEICRLEIGRKNCLMGVTIRHAFTQ